MLLYYCKKCETWKTNLDLNLYWRNREKRYFLECKECKKCRHRNNINAQYENRREYFKKWYQNNKESRADHYQKNRERTLEYCKQYYQANREQKLKYQRKWRTENPEHCRQWQKENKDKVNSHNAKRRAAQELELTVKEKRKIEIIYSISQYFGEEWHVDHIISLAQGGPHCPDNLQILTKRANLEKNARTDYIPKLNECFKL